MASQQLNALVERFRTMKNPPRNHEQWRIAWDELTRSIPAPPGTRYTEVREDGVTGGWIAGPESGEDAIILHFHGGAFALGASWNHLAMLGVLARRCAGRVFSVDYRLAPEHPYPAAHEDALAAYKWLLAGGVAASRVVMMGDSCGAALVLATVHEAMRAALPLPAAVVCLSPWVDLQQTGESMTRNASRDVFLRASTLERFAVMYAGDADRSSPRLSPLHGEFAGMPPIFIQVGGSEVLLSDGLRLADVAGRAQVPVTLEVWPDVLHEWHCWGDEVPEAAAALARVGAFVESRIPRAR